MLYDMSSAYRWIDIINGYTRCQSCEKQFRIYVWRYCCRWTVDDLVLALLSAQVHLNDLQLVVYKQHKVHFSQRAHLRLDDIGAEQSIYVAISDVILEGAPNLCVVFAIALTRQQRDEHGVSIGEGFRWRESDLNRSI